MKSAITVLRQAGAALVLVSALQASPAHADDEFPFGLEMTLDVARQPGSKRLPTLEIGDSGEVTLELWCKGGKGQFSVAGNTVIFVAGPLEDRACPPARAQADDDLVAALSEAATWKRQGDCRFVHRNENAAIPHQHELSHRRHSGALAGERTRNPEVAALDSGSREEAHPGMTTLASPKIMSAQAPADWMTPVYPPNPA